MLVVTADDLGYSAGVDGAILRAHREGIVRSASLLVTFPRAAEAAEIARAEPRLEVGLHLDLVEGRPVSDPVRVRTLIDPDGRFLGLASFLAAVATGRVRAAEIAAEVRAQVARARALGTPALAWDSHRHTHLFPLVARIVGAVAREEGARWLRRAAPAGTRGWKAALLGLATAGSALSLRGTPGNDGYVDLTFRRPPPDAVWVGLLPTLPGVVEVGAHPGPADADPADPIGRLRAHDLALLTDPLLRAAFGDEAVRWRVPVRQDPVLAGGLRPPSTPR